MSASAQFEGNKPCLNAAVTLLKQYDPEGYAVSQYWKKMGGDFSIFLDCQIQPDMQVKTAVHEAVHMISSRKDYDNIQYLYQSPDVFLTLPENDVLDLRDIANDFQSWEKDGQIHKVYFEMNQGGLYSLFNEFNSYIFGVQTLTHLDPIFSTPQTNKENINARALLIFMRGIQLALLKLKSNGRIESFKRDTRYAVTINTLWKKAEAVLTAACNAKNLGYVNRQRIAVLFEAQNVAALQGFVQKPRIFCR